MSSRFAALRAQSLEPEHAAEAGALRVGVHLGELHREALAKVVGTEVVEPGAIDGRLADGVDAELDVLRLAVVEAHALRVAEHGQRRGRRCGSRSSSGIPDRELLHVGTLT